MDNLDHCSNKDDLPKSPSFNNVKTSDHDNDWVQLFYYLKNQRLLVDDEQKVHKILMINEILKLQDNGLTGLKLKSSSFLKTLGNYVEELDDADDFDKFVLRESTIKLIEMEQLQCYTSDDTEEEDYRKICLYENQNLIDVLYYLKQKNLIKHDRILLKNDIVRILEQFQENDFFLYLDLNHLRDYLKIGFFIEPCSEKADKFLITKKLMKILQSFDCAKVNTIRSSNSMITRLKPRENGESSKDDDDEDLDYEEIDDSNIVLDFLYFLYRDKKIANNCRLITKSKLIEETRHFKTPTLKDFNDFESPYLLPIPKANTFLIPSKVFQVFQNYEDTYKKSFLFNSITCRKLGVRSSWHLAKIMKNDNFLMLLYYLRERKLFVEDCKIYKMLVINELIELQNMGFLTEISLSKRDILRTLNSMKLLDQNNIEYDKFVFTHSAMNMISTMKDMFEKTKIFQHYQTIKKLPVVDKLAIYRDQNFMHFIRYLYEKGLIKPKFRCIKRSVLKTEFNYLHSLNYFTYIDKKKLNIYLENSLIAIFNRSLMNYTVTFQCIKSLQQMDLTDRLIISEENFHSLDDESPMVQFIYYLFITNKFIKDNRFIEGNRLLIEYQTVYEVGKLKCFKIYKPLEFIKNLIIRKYLLGENAFNTQYYYLPKNLSIRFEEYKKKDITSRIVQKIKNTMSSIKIPSQIEFLLVFIRILYENGIISIEYPRVNKIFFINELLRFQRLGQFTEIKLDNANLKLLLQPLLIESTTVDLESINEITKFTFTAGTMSKLNSYHVQKMYTSMKFIPEISNQLRHDYSHNFIDYVRYNIIEFFDYLKEIGFLQYSIRLPKSETKKQLDILKSEHRKFRYMDGSHLQQYFENCEFAEVREDDKYFDLTSKLLEAISFWNMTANYSKPDRDIFDLLYYLKENSLIENDDTIKRNTMVTHIQRLQHYNTIGDYDAEKAIEYLLSENIARLNEDQTTLHIKTEVLSNYVLEYRKSAIYTKCFTDFVEYLSYLKKCEFFFNENSIERSIIVAELSKLKCEHNLMLRFEVDDLLNIFEEHKFIGEKNLQVPKPLMNKINVNLNSEMGWFQKYSESVAENKNISIELESTFVLDFLVDLMLQKGISDDVSLSLDNIQDEWFNHELTNAQSFLGVELKLMNIYYIQCEDNGDWILTRFGKKKLKEFDERRQIERLNKKQAMNNAERGMKLDDDRLNDDHQSTSNSMNKSEVMSTQHENFKSQDEDVEKLSICDDNHNVERLEFVEHAMIGDENERKLEDDDRLTDDHQSTSNSMNKPEVMSTQHESFKSPDEDLGKLSICDDNHNVERLEFVEHAMIGDENQRKLEDDDRLTDDHTSNTNSIEEVISDFESPNESVEKLSTCDTNHACIVSSNFIHLSSISSDDDGVGGSEEQYQNTTDSDNTSSDVDDINVDVNRNLNATPDHHFPAQYQFDRNKKLNLQSVKDGISSSSSSSIVSIDYDEENDREANFIDFIFYLKQKQLLCDQGQSIEKFLLIDQFREIQNLSILTDISLENDFKEEIACITLDSLDEFNQFIFDDDFLVELEDYTDEFQKTNLYRWLTKQNQTCTNTERGKSISSNYQNDNIIDLFYYLFKNNTYSEVSGELKKLKRSTFLELVQLFQTMELFQYIDVTSFDLNLFCADMIEEIPNDDDDVYTLTPQFLMAIFNRGKYYDQSNLSKKLEEFDSENDDSDDNDENNYVNEDAGSGKEMNQSKNQQLVSVSSASTNVKRTGNFLDFLYYLKEQQMIVRHERTSLKLNVLTAEFVRLQNVMGLFVGWEPEKMRNYLIGPQTPKYIEKFPDPNVIIITEECKQLIWSYTETYKQSALYKKLLSISGLSTHSDPKKNDSFYDFLYYLMLKGLITEKNKLLQLSDVTENFNKLKQQNLLENFTASKLHYYIFGPQTPQIAIRTENPNEAKITDNFYQLLCNHKKYYLESAIYDAVGDDDKKENIDDDDTSGVGVSSSLTTTHLENDWGTKLEETNFFNFVSFLLEMELITFDKPMAKLEVVSEQLYHLKKLNCLTGFMLSHEVEKYNNLVEMQLTEGSNFIVFTCEMFRVLSDYKPVYTQSKFLKSLNNNHEAEPTSNVTKESHNETVITTITSNLKQPPGLHDNFNDFVYFLWNTNKINLSDRSVSLSTIIGEFSRLKRAGCLIGYEKLKIINYLFGPQNPQLFHRSNEPDMVIISAEILQLFNGYKAEYNKSKICFVTTNNVQNEPLTQSSVNNDTFEVFLYHMLNIGLIKPGGVLQISCVQKEFDKLLSLNLLTGLNHQPMNVHLMGVRNVLPQTNANDLKCISGSYEIIKSLEDEYKSSKLCAVLSGREKQPTFKSTSKDELQNVVVNAQQLEVIELPQIFCDFLCYVYGLGEISFKNRTVLFSTLEGHLQFVRSKFVAFEQVTSDSLQYMLIKSEIAAWTKVWKELQFSEKCITKISKLKLEDTYDFLCYMQHCQIIKPPVSTVKISNMLNEFEHLKELHYFPFIETKNLLNNLTSRRPVVAEIHSKNIVFNAKMFSLINSKYKDYEETSLYKNCNGKAAVIKQNSLNTLRPSQNQFVPISINPVRVDNTNDFLCFLAHREIISPTKNKIQIATVEAEFEKLKKLNFYGNIQTFNIINNIVGRIPVIAVKSKSILIFNERAFKLITYSYQDYWNSDSYKAVLNRKFSIEGTHDEQSDIDTKVNQSVSYAGVMTNQTPKLLSDETTIRNSTNTSTTSLNSCSREDNTYDFLCYLRDEGLISPRKPTIKSHQIIAELKMMQNNFCFTKIPVDCIINNILGRQVIIAERVADNITFNASAFQLIEKKYGEYKRSKAFEFLQISNNQLDPIKEAINVTSLSKIQPLSLSGTCKPVNNDAVFPESMVDRVPSAPLYFGREDRTFDFLCYLKDCNIISAQNLSIKSKVLLHEFQGLKNMKLFANIKTEHIISNIHSHQNPVIANKSINYPEIITFNNNALKLIAEKYVEYKNSNLYRTICRKNDKFGSITSNQSTITQPKLTTEQMDNAPAPAINNQMISKLDIISSPPVTTLPIVSNRDENIYDFLCYLKDFGHISQTKLTIKFVALSNEFNRLKKKKLFGQIDLENILHAIFNQLPIIAEKSSDDSEIIIFTKRVFVLIKKKYNDYKNHSNVFRVVGYKIENKSVDDDDDHPIPIKDLARSVSSINLTKNQYDFLEFVDKEVLIRHHTTYGHDPPDSTFYQTSKGCPICRLNFDTEKNFRFHISLHNDNAIENPTHYYDSIVQFRLNFEIIPDQNEIIFTLTCIRGVKTVDQMFMFHAKNTIEQLCCNKFPNEIKADETVQFKQSRNLFNQVPHSYPIYILFRSDNYEYVEQHNFVLNKILPKLLKFPENFEQDIDAKKRILRREKELRLSYLPFYLPSKVMRAVFDYNFELHPAMKPEETTLLLLLDSFSSQPIYERLTSANYDKMLSRMLEIEDIYCEYMMKSFDKREQTLHYRNGYYVLPVENLSEHRPTLMTNDEVVIIPEILQPGIPIRKQKVEGIIFRVECDVVIIKLDKTIDETVTYRIHFEMNRCNIRLEQRALSIISLLKISPFFFPDRVPNKLADKNVQLEWFNKTIETNPEQKQAVTNIILGLAHPLPYIIFGPPGTGKTMTIVEAIVQLYNTAPSSRILITTGSNSACNEISMRLLKYVENEDLLRLFAASQEHAASHIEDEIIDISNLESGIHYYPPIEEITRYRIILSTVTVAGKLVQANINPHHFTHVFIDECGSITETMALIPIVGMITTEQKIHGNIILAGDPKQLGPILQSTRADKLGLGVSMLERLMNLSVYQRDPNTNQYNPNVITKLLRNYRSHPAILQIPNDMFYDGDLIAKGKNETINWALNWRHLPNPNFPIIFRSVSGKCQQEKNSPSWFNQKELNVLKIYLNQLLGRKINGRNIEESDIGIISPYRKQCQKIRDYCTSMNWTNIEVASVEAFQGREKSVIIISTVRSQMSTLGFLTNEKRLNVALTRAKALMIVIGDHNLLKQDQHWRCFIEYCIDNQCLV